MTDPTKTGAGPHQTPATAAGRAEIDLVEIIRQLRANGYADWPDWLERSVLPVVREAEAAARPDLEALVSERGFYCILPAPHTGLHTGWDRHDQWSVMEAPEPPVIHDRLAVPPLLPDDDQAVERLLDAVMEVYYPDDPKLVTKEIRDYVRANEIPRLIAALRDGRTE
jgi:hypothetical protein